MVQLEGHVQRGWKKINTWPIKGPLIVAAGVLGFFDHVLHSRAPLAGAMAVVISVIGFRDFWNNAKFWATVVFLAFAQVPLVLAARPMLAQEGLAFAFLFTIVDCAAMVLVISWVCVSEQ